MEIIGYTGNCQSPGKSGQINIEGNPVWWMNVVIVLSVFWQYSASDCGQHLGSRWSVCMK